MQLINSIELTPRQKKIVKRICSIQLASLDELMEIEHDEDEQELELDPGSIHRMTEMTRIKFLKVLENPESFPQLEPLDMSVFKHILYREISDEIYHTSKPKLLAKVWQMERISQYQNLN